MHQQLPDLLSLSRIPCAVAVLLLYSDEDKWRFGAAMGVIALALATDFLDGALARRWRVETERGYVLDGLGDRAMYVSLLLAFLVQQRIGLLITWLLIFREVAIYAIRLFSREWYDANKSVRRLSRIHAGVFRAWIFLILVASGVRLFGAYEILRERSFVILEDGLLTTVLIVSYYALLRSIWTMLATADT